MIEVRRRFAEAMPGIAVTLMLCSPLLIGGCGARETSPANDANTTGSNVKSESPAGLVLDLTGEAVDLLAAPAESGLVVIFLRTDCPVGNRYAPTISKLYDSYSARGIRFALVYPEGSESAEDVQQHVDEYSLDIDAYRDPDRDMVSRVGATVTPEAIVFDRHRQMVYRGRIDDRAFELGRERPRPTTHDLREVLDAILTGAALQFSTTEAIGCFIE